MTVTTKTDLRPIARPSGAFAMLAVDQREALRVMIGETQSQPVSDAQVTDFKLRAMRALTPHASAVLVDRQFAWEQAVEAKVTAAGCGLIAAADQFIASQDEIVGDVKIDTEMVPARVREQGAVAMKLLVLWRPDESADGRIAMVDEFVARCRNAGLISIIEPVARKPRDGRTWNVHDGILAAAKELGSRGADLYKAEVPQHGQGDEADIRRQCADLTRAIASPWVVLSSGVPQEQFPTAVEWACREGASGFLAGRAVWRAVIGAADLDRALLEDAVPRLERLAALVDRVVTA
jgi:sulfofructosephosphate aldolase